MQILLVNMVTFQKTIKVFLCSGAGFTENDRFLEKLLQGGRVVLQRHIMLIHRGYNQQLIPADLPDGERRIVRDFAYDRKIDCSIENLTDRGMRIRLQDTEETAGIFTAVPRQNWRKQVGGRDCRCAERDHLSHRV